MAPAAPPRALVLVLLAACGIAGGYGTMVAGFKNGFFEAITNCAQEATIPYIPGGPAPFTTQYTGIAALDNRLVFLVAFFAALIDGEKGWEVTLSFWYLMAQLWAGWTLLSLEGLRNGNKGRAVSWTGTMGIIFQNITYTITVPVYLIIYILTSPLARPASMSPHLVEVDVLDLQLLPLCTVAALVIPSIAMGLPAPSVISGSTHYSLVAFWQAFPLWQSALHWTLKRVLGSPSSPPRSKRSSSTAAATAYRLVLFFAVASQTVLLAVALTPASAVPDSWSPGFSALTSLRSALVPAPLWAPPTVDPAAAPLPADSLAPLALYFLQWDVYCGGAAVMLWALYLRRVAVVHRGGHNGGGWAGLLGKVLGWGVIGGPVAVAAVLLWERDEAVARGGGKSE